MKPKKETTISSAFKRAQQDPAYQAAQRVIIRVSHEYEAAYDEAERAERAALATNPEYQSALQRRKDALEALQLAKVKSKRVFYAAEEAAKKPPQTTEPPDEESTWGKS